MELKVFLLNNQKHLEKSSPSTFFRTDPSSHNGQPPFWIDCAKPDPVSLSEFFSPLNLHPLVLEGCLDPATGLSIAPFEQSLFIKIPLHLSWDSFISTFLIIVVLPYAVITVHETPIPILERMEREFSSATRFRVVGPSAILYQMLDHVIDEDMVFALEARRAIDALEETMDQEEDAVEIDEILILKRRVSRLTATIEDQRYCITSLQTVESDAFELGESREYFRDLLAHLESTVRSLGRQQTHLAELHQHHLLTLQDKTNSRLKVLTILLRSVFAVNVDCGYLRDELQKYAGAPLALWLPACPHHNGNHRGGIALDFL
jgi:magnesium transporter